MERKYKMNQTKMLGSEKIGKLLLKKAVPAVIAQLISLLYNMVYRIFIGHIPEIGATALTGVGLYMPIYALLAACALLIGAGGAPMMSMALGKGDQKEAEKILGNSFTGMVIIIPAMFAAGILTMPDSQDLRALFALHKDKIME